MWYPLCEQPSPIVTIEISGHPELKSVLFDYVFNPNKRMNSKEHLQIHLKNINFTTEAEAKP